MKLEAVVEVVAELRPYDQSVVGSNQSGVNVQVPKGGATFPIFM